MDRFIHLCNGRELDEEIALGFRGAKCFVRDMYGSTRTQKRIAELRGIGCFFEQINIDILQSQVFDANHNMVSGCTQFRNGITYQTNAAIQNICYGLPSLLFHYAQICPGGTIFLGDITTDHNERHFSNLKSRGAKTLDQMSAAESRGNCHNVLMTQEFVKTGNRHIKKMRKGKGNSEDAIDENLYMMQEEGGHSDDEDAPLAMAVAAAAAQLGRKHKKKKRAKRVVVDLKAPVDYHDECKHKPKRARLRMGKKCIRAVAAGGAFVVPSGF